MKVSSTWFILVSSLVLLSWTAALAAESLSECVTRISQNQYVSNNEVFTRDNPSYLPILQERLHNQRFNTTWSSKPWVIVTPKTETEVQLVIRCAKQHGYRVRVRSGGHDYEGLSYTTQFVSDPFLLLDLTNMRNITVDVKEKSAWVESGATLGELYYAIGRKSRTLGFPAGVCPQVGVGGQFSGGGYGVMLRKYGLAADNIIDARLVDANGRVVDRKSMGEDYFWAIRGGGGNSFGVVLAWKIQLVDVPENVTVFDILHKNKTNLVHKWQSVAPFLPPELLIRLNIARYNGQKVVAAAFKGLYLGRAGTLFPIMQNKFPELELQREDYIEMSWIEAMVHFDRHPMGTPIVVLLSRNPSSEVNFKAKSDYVKKAIPVKALEGLWKLFLEEEEGSSFQMLATPHGGRMDEISESSLPYPHRAGNLYKIHYYVSWKDDSNEAGDRHISWMRRVYDYMAPFVSQSPREAYINYRDVDIGMNNNVVDDDGNTSYAQAKVWGEKYFKNNFDRLVRIKTMVDPTNFFRNEQSIPPRRLTLQL